MSLYPSLEDMKVDQMAKVEHKDLYLTGAKEPSHSIEAGPFSEGSVYIWPGLAKNVCICCSQWQHWDGKAQWNGGVRNVCRQNVFKTFLPAPA